MVLSHDCIMWSYISNIIVYSCIRLHNCIIISCLIGSQLADGLGAGQAGGCERERERKRNAERQREIERYEEHRGCEPGTKMVTDRARGTPRVRALNQNGYGQGRHGEKLYQNGYGKDGHGDNLN